MKSFSIGKALRFGWESIEKNFWLLLGLAAISYALSLPASWVVEGGLWWLILILVVLNLIINVLIGIGIIKIGLALTDGQPVRFHELYSNRNLFFKYLLTSLLIGVIVLLGMVLLIIPGIYFAIKYSFSLFFVVDQGARPVAALKESSRITEGVKWRIFAFGLVIIAIVVGVALLNVLLAGILTLFAGTTILMIIEGAVVIFMAMLSFMATVAYADVYRQLLSEEGPVQQ